MIRKSIVLSCDRARAFALFTERASDWWPVDRRHTPDAASAIRMVADGRFWERASDGHEVELGRVRAWEPPDRLLLDFYPGTSADQPTEVEVTFADAAEGTLVTVEHRPTAASAALWPARAARFDASWDLLLPALAAALGPR